MKIISFNKSDSDSFFKYELDGIEETIDYNPPASEIDEKVDINEYSVELLINPILNGQSHIFALNQKIADQKKKIGYVFPISALDNDQTQSKEIANYFYVAFYVLLSRLKDVKEGDFSDNFEGNVCVSVINKKLACSDNPLPLCIHSLRKFCYSYFTPENHIQPIKGYTKDRLLDNPNQKTIYVDLSIPQLYSHPMIDRIMRDLVNANNVTHRFVLLYQVIEFLMEDAIIKDIEDIYDKLSAHDITPSDYFEDVSHVSKERTRIKNIFNECNVLSSTEFASFRTACRLLLRKAGFSKDANSDNHELFYAFRNKMTHSYRRLYVHEQELVEVVQYFERIVMQIVGAYPRAIM